MLSEILDDVLEGVDGLQLVSQACPTHAPLDLSPVRMLCSPYADDILRLKAFGYDVYTGTMSVVIHEHKLCDDGPTPKHTHYMLFQNDVQIDLAYHGSSLKMHVSSGTQNIPPNEQSWHTEMVSFNDVILVVTQHFSNCGTRRPWGGA
ncbi:hypothetical protein TNCV_1082091 [Trichonephila clavipes]|nr:hypothetical protein TNCV_1082091 [Trichonephila clavipes]